MRWVSKVVQTCGTSLVVDRDCLGKMQPRKNGKTQHSTKPWHVRTCFASCARPALEIDQEKPQTMGAQSQEEEKGAQNDGHIMICEGNLLAGP